MHFTDFIGKRIEETHINKNKTHMIWKVDGQWYNLRAIGDCCSHSWYEHCDNASALDNATVLEIDEVSQDSEVGEYGSEIKVDMIKLKTDKGHCTIEFRNDSNGYYSGWTSFSEADGVDLDMKKLEDF